MRILHTADWHLGRKLSRVDRLAEQERMLEDLVDAADRLDPHVVVVAGDVFDFFTPSAEAEQLYYRALREISAGGQRAVLVVAGNHDSSARLAAPRRILGDIGVIVAGDPHDPDELPDPAEHAGFTIEASGPGWVQLSIPGAGSALFHLLPFPSRARLPPALQPQEFTAGEIVQALQDDLPAFEGPTFLVSHLYVRSGAQAAEEDRDDFVGGAYAVDPVVLDPYDAAFLGHLHTRHGGPCWRYSGALLQFDFDDPATERGAWLWEDGAWRFEPLTGGRQLLVETVGSVDEALERAEQLEEAWIRLVFEAGTFLSPAERRQVKKAYGDRLVDIQFQVPEPEEGGQRPLPELGEIDPEQAFRTYYEQEEGAPPPDEMVDLLLDVLQEGAA